MNTKPGISFALSINPRELALAVHLRPWAFRFGGTFISVIVGPLWLQLSVNY